MRNLQKNVILLCSLLIIVLVAGLFALPKNESTQTIDLIGGYDWSHFAGAKQTEHGLTISPLTRTIQAQDNANEWANPPVNLAGPSLKYTDDFKIDVTTDGLNIGNSIRLYGGVPIVYDEWRLEPASIDIKNEGEYLKVSLWDGESSNADSVKEYSISAAPKNLRFEKSNNLLTLVADGNYIFGVDAKPVFRSGKLWFGVSIGSSRSLLIKSMSVSSKPGVVSVHEGLNTTAQTPFSAGRIKFGAAVSLNPLLTDEKYRELALNNFNIWTPENELKTQFIHPNQNIYSFNEADLLVDTAINNNIAVHGHALVFGEANPPWIRTAPDSQKQAIMIDHINNVMSHYKGRIKGWDVINEPLSDEEGAYGNGDNGLRKHLWYQALGPEYISTALKAARAADPEAKLFINDYGLEADGQRWQALLKLVDSLQAQDVPLDGIGFEAHIHESSDRVNREVLSKHMRDLARRGLSVRISEIDVFGEEGTTKQATDYTSVLIACMGQPNCVAYSTWGISDKYGSTTEYESYPPIYGNDLLWDSAFKPKPAYQEVLKILENVK